MAAVIQSAGRPTVGSPGSHILDKEVGDNVLGEWSVQNVGDVDGFAGITFAADGGLSIPPSPQLFRVGPGKTVALAVIATVIDPVFDTPTSVFASLQLFTDAGLIDTHTFRINITTPLPAQADLTSVGTPNIT